MKQFTAKNFDMPKLKGISEKSLEEHLKLYQGYVKNANLVLEQSQNLKKETEKNIYLLGELARRFSFEYNGIRNHEAYFEQFTGGPKEINKNSSLNKALGEEFGSFEDFLKTFKTLALTRGVGWAMLWYDHKDSRLLVSWVDEQHLGQLNDCKIILGLDMWEHSYVYDYQPSGKKNYVEDFFANLNWGIAEKRFEDQ